MTPPRGRGHARRPGILFQAPLGRSGPGLGGSSGLLWPVIRCPWHGHRRRSVRTGRASADTGGHTRLESKTKDCRRAIRSLTGGRSDLRVTFMLRQSAPFRNCRATADHRLGEQRRAKISDLIADLEMPTHDVQHARPEGRRLNDIGRTTAQPLSPTSHQAAFILARSLFIAPKRHRKNDGPRGSLPSAQRR